MAQIRIIHTIRYRFDKFESLNFEIVYTHPGILTRPTFGLYTLIQKKKQQKNINRIKYVETKY